MKKIIISICAVAALAACTKSEIQYDEPAEIGFAPATKNITKAAGLAGILDTAQELGIWAFWDNDAAVPVNTDGTSAGVISNPTYDDYTDNYLVNALFAKRDDISNWGGSPTGYPWPVNGALVFAGYTTPGDAVLTTGTNAGNVNYVLSTDTMTFTEYENTNEFDLCWFGKTASAYNYRAAGTAVGVTLSHALTWVSVAVYGEGTPVGNWTITSISLENVTTKGTATCSGSTNKATWTSTTATTATAPLSIYSGSHTITAGTTNGGKTTGVTLTDNVLIPSTTVKLKVNYTFLVNGVAKQDSKTITLNEDETWESGVHYIYTLQFKGNEILVAPSYNDWGTPVDETITVE